MDYQLQLMAKLTKSLGFLERFRRLPSAAVFDGDSAYCAICLNDIRGGDRYREVAECGHSFHGECIDAWLKSHSTCPLCRTQIPQMISLNLNENGHHFSALISNVVLLFHSFVEKMCNPLNDDLASMLCAGSLR